MIHRILIFLFIGYSLYGYSQEKPNKCDAHFRWSVKVMTDPGGEAILSTTPSDSAFDRIIEVKAPVHISFLSKKDARLPRFKDEKQMIRTVAYIEKLEVMADRDLHIILKSPESGRMMVAEIPDPDCPQLDDHPLLRETYSKAWSQVEQIKELQKNKKPVLVEITGVPFWDARHWWLHGCSKNGRELHPVVNVIVITDSDDRK